MSVFSLPNSAESKIDIGLLNELAEELIVTILDSQDAQAYLLLLQSLEAVLQHVKDGPDYSHPALEPQDTVESRDYWKPDQAANPLNAWSHQCSFRSAKPTSNILQGRTIVVKDNVSVGGLPTTLGTFPQVLSEEGVFPISQIDATVVSRVLSAGAVIRGTSTCENFCASPLAYTAASGLVHHPLLHGYTTGGSSSGSAALVAARVAEKSMGKSFGDTVELAIGSDQAGSIRVPASYTGIYGLKPTSGLIPYTGAASMSPLIDHLGPIASSLEDIAALLKVMSGYDGIDSRMTPESPLLTQVKNYPQLLAGFRSQGVNKEKGSQMKIGFLVESFKVAGLSTDVHDTVRHAAKFFEAAGAEVVDVSVPMHSEGPIIWTASTRPSMSGWLCQGKPPGYLSYLPPHIEIPWPLSQEVYELLTATNPALVNIILSERFSQRAFGPTVEAKAHRKAFELRAAYDRALEEVDVLITPCTPTISMPHPQMVDEQGNRTSIMEKLRTAIGLTSNTCPFNVTGHPALSAPCGSSCPPDHPDVKLPIGLQIIGRRWGDEMVLKAAVLLEEGRRIVELTVS